MSSVPAPENIMSPRKLLLLLAILLAGTIGAFILTLRLSEASRWVQHTIGVEVRAGEVLASALDAETGQRGFLLTRDRNYLAPLEQARRELPARVAELRNLTGDNPEQQQSISALENLVKDKFAEIDATIVLAMADKHNEALARVRDNSGKELMDAVRARVSEIQRREAELLDVRSRDAQRAGNWLLAAIVTALLSGLLLALTIAAGLRYQITQLETLVSERTAQLQVLTQELAHRSTNLLAVTQSLASQTARVSESVEAMKDGLIARLGGLARSQQVLLGRDASGASLHELVRKQIAPFADARQYSLSGTDATLTPAQVQALGLALHELATNATKYGALSTPSGSVMIDTTVEAGHLHVEWQERGGPTVSKPTRRGFGTNVIGRITELGLGAKVSHEFAGEGVRWKVEFALAVGEPVPESGSLGSA